MGQLAATWLAQVNAKVKAKPNKQTGRKLCSLLLVCDAMGNLSPLETCSQKGNRMNRCTIHTADLLPPPIQ